MRLKFLIDEDCVNSKYTSMVLGFSTCSFKCGKSVCQNAKLINEPDILISKEQLCKRYKEGKDTIRRIYR